MFRQIHITFALIVIKRHQSESPPTIVINPELDGVELEENSHVRKEKIKEGTETKRKRNGMRKEKQEGNYLTQN